MAALTTEEISKFLHSPAHLAIARRDHSTLRRILASVPLPAKAGEVRTEEQSVLAEQRADEASAVIDRRDVPGRETPLHLAVRLGDAEAVEMLMASGADWSLQNEHGWSALQEAVCAREDAIAMIITRYYQPMAWAKWCRRLPRLTGAMRRMRDFYMELTFHFESSVIPFIGRIAPSDTYRIWKRGSNLRADMTLAGFDGFRIHRSDQSFLFLGDGSEDGKLPAGSLCVLSHKEKEVMNALEGAGVQPSEAEIAQEVAAMSQTNMYRPGIDVTQAELVSHLTWRRQERTEMVGSWKAKIYDMHHVMVSVRSRRVPGAMTDEELFAVEGDRHDGVEFDEDYADVLTSEEKLQLESALRRDNFDFGDEGGFDDGLGRPSRAGGLPNGSYDSFEEEVEAADDDYNFHSSPSPFVERHEYHEAAAFPSANNSSEKKGWFGWGRKSVKVERKSSAHLEEKPSSSAETPRRVSRQPGGTTGHRRSVDYRGSERQLEILESRGRHSVDVCAGRRASVDRRASSYTREDDSLIASRRGGKDSKLTKKSSKEPVRRRKTEGNHESEYKKGLRPVLWLTPDFPLQTEELLPLLDILANKVKAVRRLRELLTTKMPPGTFPVKVAIPVVPTIRVVITFTKFEELKSSEEFSTPVSSPGHFQDSKEKDGDAQNGSGGSWFSWIRGGSQNQGSNGAVFLEDHLDQEVDPFEIPSDYQWVDMNEKKRRMKEKKGKSKKGKKPVRSRADMESDNDTM
ncbi:unnamed protein product [Calypogeia fissa]